MSNQPMTRELEYSDVIPVALETFETKDLANKLIDFRESMADLLELQEVLKRQRETVEQKIKQNKETQGLIMRILWKRKEKEKDNKIMFGNNKREI